MKYLALLLLFASSASAQTINPITTGNTPGLVGSATSNHCVKFNDTNGNLADAGAACGTGAGSVTSVSSPNSTITIGTPTTTPTLDVVYGTTANTALQGNMIGTSGATIPLLSTANTWTLAQTYSAGVAIASGQGAVWNADTAICRKSAGDIEFSSSSACGNGGTIEAATLTIGSNIKFVSGHIGISMSQPSVSSGFGTGASVLTNSGTAAFTVGVGTSNTGTGVLTMPTVTGGTGWACTVNDITTKSANVFVTQVTATSTSSVTVQNYTTAAATHAWTDSDVLQFQCMGY